MKTKISQLSTGELLKIEEDNRDRNTLHNDILFQAARAELSSREEEKKEIELEKLKANLIDCEQKLKDAIVRLELKVSKMEESKKKIDTEIDETKSFIEYLNQYNF